MENVLVKIQKPSRVVIEIFLMEKFYNLWFVNEKFMEIFLEDIFDPKDQYIWSRWWNEKIKLGISFTYCIIKSLESTCLVDCIKKKRRDHKKVV